MPTACKLGYTYATSMLRMMDFKSLYKDELHKIPQNVRRSHPNEKNENPVLTGTNMLWNLLKSP